METPKACPECGCTETETSNGGYIYCTECQYELGTDPNWEPGDVDGEAFRGGEAAAYEAETQAWIQRNLK